MPTCTGFFSSLFSCPNEFDGKFILLLTDKVLLALLAAFVALVAKLLFDRYQQRQNYTMLRTVKEQESLADVYHALIALRTASNSLLKVATRAALLPDQEQLAKASVLKEQCISLSAALSATFDARRFWIAESKSSLIVIAIRACSEFERAVLDALAEENPVRKSALVEKLPNAAKEMTQALDAIRTSTQKYVPS